MHSTSLWCCGRTHDQRPNDAAWERHGVAHHDQTSGLGFAVGFLRKAQPSSGRLDQSDVSGSFTGSNEQPELCLRTQRGNGTTCSTIEVHRKRQGLREKLILALLIPYLTGVLADAFDGTNLADQRTAVVLYALIALLMSTVWIPLFVHLRRNPQMFKSDTEPDYFQIEVLRPVVGAAGYVVAALLGWFVHPGIAVALFILVASYYAVTCTGVREMPRLRLPRLRSA